MNIQDLLHEDEEVTYYINESIRMIYHNEQNETKMFWWWLNKFEYLAIITEMPDDNMAEIFLEMVHKNIHERVKNKFPAIKFTELSYEEIINHYICYLNQSTEILSQRNSYKHRNNCERELIRGYACDLQNIYNNSIYRYHLQKRIANQYIFKFYDIELTKYIKKTIPFSFQYTAGYIFAKMIELARYINPAISMIQIYNSKNTENFHDWLHKFEYVTNKVLDNRILEYFNNMVDNDVHLAVKMTYPAINLSELPYEKIINFYIEYLAPSDDTDLHETRFLCRKQYKRETIDNYANSLKKLFDRCSKTFRLDEVLYKQFLNGIFDNEVKTILKKLHGFSFDEMVAFATELIKIKKITTYLQPAYSRLKTFHPINEEEFYEWLNKFEYVAGIIGVSSDDEIVKLFNTMVHTDIHARVQEYYSCVNFSELSYEEIVHRYLRCLSLSTKSYFHRKRLHCRKQYEQETIENYARVLHKLYDKCKYTDLSDKRLREHFLNGINDNKIKTYIRKYSDLSYDPMVAIAIAHSNEISLMEDEYKA